MEIEPPLPCWTLHEDFLEVSSGVRLTHMLNTLNKQTRRRWSTKGGARLTPNEACGGCLSASPGAALLFVLVPKQNSGTSGGK